jgi:hypothetical protein
LKKCLSAGFDFVALVSAQKSFFAQSKELAARSISAEDITRIRFLLPEELIIKKFEA